MKNIFKFLFIFLFINLNYGQTKDLDSLKHLLKRTSSDSLKIELIEKIQISYRKKDLDKHKSYLLQGLELAIKNKKTQKEGIFTREYGIYFKYKDRLDSSFFYYEKAKSIFKSIKDSSNYFVTISSIGNLKKKQGDYKGAIKCFIESISYHESKTDRKSNLNAQMAKLNLANVYVNMDQDEKAIQSYLSILKNESSKHSKRLLNVTYNNLSGTYQKLKKLDSSLLFAKKI